MIVYTWELVFHHNSLSDQSPTNHWQPCPRAIASTAAPSVASFCLRSGFNSRLTSKPHLGYFWHAWKIPGNGGIRTVISCRPPRRIHTPDPRHCLLADPFYERLGRTATFPIHSPASRHPPHRLPHVGTTHLQLGRAEEERGGETGKKCNWVASKGQPPDWMKQE